MPQFTHTSACRQPDLLAIAAELEGCSLGSFSLLLELRQEAEWGGGLPFKRSDPHEEHVSTEPRSS